MKNISAQTPARTGRSAANCRTSQAFYFLAWTSPPVFCALLCIEYVGLEIISFALSPDCCGQEVCLVNAAAAALCFRNDRQQEVGLAVRPGVDGNFAAEH